MENSFAEAMFQQTDSELIMIVYEKYNDYRPEAVEAAKMELIKRNITDEYIQDVIKKNDIKKQYCL